MSDIKNLFDDLARSAAAPPSSETVDADLARGRAALTRAHRQRTIRRSVIAGGSLVAAVAVAVAAVGLNGTGDQVRHGPRAFSSGPVRPQPHHRTHSIKLVSYSGKQLEGFTVDAVPAGWHLSTSTQYALLITPDDGSLNDNPNDFEGKLAVLTSSSDEHGLGHGDDVTVNGEAGVVSDQGKYGIMLRYNDPNGFGVDIQAPATLHWSDQQIVQFAEGVHVTGNAVHSVG
jgi:hypothetical protein